MRGVWTVLICSAVVVGGPGRVEADDQRIARGRETFMRYCASCHGEDATGNGPLAAELRVAPADLTGIQQRNGGRWPFTRLLEVIDGRREVRVHGPRDMPVWGKRFVEAEGGGAPGEIGARDEILALIEFLKSLQRDTPAESGDGG